MTAETTETAETAEAHVHIHLHLHVHTCDRGRASRCEDAPTPTHAHAVAASSGRTVSTTPASPDARNAPSGRVTLPRGYAGATWLLLQLIHDEAACRPAHASPRVWDSRLALQALDAVGWVSNSDRPRNVTGNMLATLERGGHLRRVGYGSYTLAAS